MEDIEGQRTNKKVVKQPKRFKCVNCGSRTEKKPGMVCDSCWRSVKEV